MSQQKSKTAFKLSAYPRVRADARPLYRCFVMLIQSIKIFPLSIPAARAKDTFIAFLVLAMSPPWDAPFIGVLPGKITLSAGVPLAEGQRLEGKLGNAIPK